jgi:hypothetical protein
MGEVKERIWVDAGYDSYGSIVETPLDCAGCRARSVEPTPKGDN